MGARYSIEVADRICKRISQGEAVIAICRDADMPSEHCFYEWVRGDKDGLATKYAHAREIQAEVWAERAIAEAKNAADAGLGRLSFDAVRWYVSKIAPKRFGEKIQQEHTGADGGPIKIVDDRAPLSGFLAEFSKPSAE